MGGIVFRPGSCVSPDPSSTPTPSTRRRQRLSCTKPAGKPIAVADRWIPHCLLLGMPLRKKLKSFSFSPQETCCWKRPPTDRRWIPPMPFVSQLPNAPEHELQPFFTRNCGGCSLQNLPCQITRGHSDTSSRVSISGGHTREKLREIKCTPSKKPGNATSWSGGDTIGALLEPETS